MTKAPRKRTPKRRNERVLLSMTGDGVKDGWITFKLPAWLVACIVIAAVVVAIAIIASPELAAQIGALLAQWLHHATNVP
jgi:hypothetical protein